MAESEGKLSQAHKDATAAATEAQLAREALAAAQRERREEAAAVRQQHEATLEQVSTQTLGSRPAGGVHGPHSSHLNPLVPFNSTCGQVYTCRCGRWHVLFRPFSLLAMFA